MKKIVITILALLFIPTIAAGAADDLVFDADTDLTVNGVTLKLLSGATVDQIAIPAGEGSVTFSLSAGSSLTIRSYDRRFLTNNGGVSVSCNNSYSELSVTGAPTASLTVTPSSEVCASTATPTGGGGGGGGGAVVPTAPTTPITSTGEVTATASGGGQTTLTTGEGTTAAVSLPANAVSVSTNVAIVTESQTTVTASRPVPSSRSVVGGYVYNYTAAVSGTTVSSFDQSVTLTFTYTDNQISGLTESSLRVFYWDETNSQWIALTTTVNVDTNTLTADTTHFTYFAIMALTEGTEEEEGLVEETPETTVVDGDLIRNPNAEGVAQFDIYIVKLVGTKKFKRLILSPHVFESYEHFDKNGNGSPWDDVLDVSQATMDGNTTSNLVRAVGDDKVYKLVAAGDTGTKRWMNMTATRFASQGNDSDSIYEINATDRNAYTTGLDITDGEAASSETIIIKISSLRVRNLPSTDGEVLTNVSEGEIYPILDEQDGWYKITANSVTGWCYGGDTGGYAAKQ